MQKIQRKAKYKRWRRGIFMKQSTKFSKILTILVVFTLLISTLTGCADITPQEFKVQEMNITLDANFSQEELDNATACFKSLGVLVIVEKFSFEDLEKDDITADSTIEDFSKFLIKDYVLESFNLTFNVSENGNYLFTDYSKNVEGEAYTFYPCLYKSDNGFWVVNFCCLESYYSVYKEDFKAWADSVYMTSIE